MSVSLFDNRVAAQGFERLPVPLIPQLGSLPLAGVLSLSPNTGGQACDLHSANWTGWIPLPGQAPELGGLSSPAHYGHPPAILWQAPERCSVMSRPRVPPRGDVWSGHASWAHSLVLLLSLRREGAPPVTELGLPHLPTRVLGPAATVTARRASPDRALWENVKCSCLCVYIYIVTSTVWASFYTL